MHLLPSDLGAMMCVSLEVAVERAGANEEEVAPALELELGAELGMEEREEDA